MKAFAIHFKKELDPLLQQMEREAGSLIALTVEWHFESIKKKFNRWVKQELLALARVLDEVGLL